MPRVSTAIKVVTSGLAFAALVYIVSDDQKHEAIDKSVQKMMDAFDQVRRTNPEAKYVFPHMNTDQGFRLSLS